MAKNSMILVGIVVVAIVVIAGAVFIFNNGGHDEPVVQPVASILVEDQNGVYFWTDGAGETIADCLADTTAGVTVTMTDSSFGQYIQEINGLAGTLDYTGYWSVYLYKSGAWTSSDLGVSSLKTEENSVVGLFYVITDPLTYEIVKGGPENVTVPAVADKEIWHGETAGTIFCIQGASGLYFYINDNTGTTMAERFAAATTAYKVPFVASKSGISSLFGIKSEKKLDDEGNPVIDPSTGYEVWNYWAQYGLKDGKWDYMSTTLPNTEADSLTQMAIAYGDGGMGSASGLTAPIYKA